MVGSKDPCDGLDRYRLAGAVVADQRRHLAGRKLEVDVLERLHRTEVLRDSLEAKERLGAVLGGRHRVPSRGSNGGRAGAPPRKGGAQAKARSTGSLPPCTPELPSGCRGPRP